MKERMILRSKKHQRRFKEALMKEELNGFFLHSDKMYFEKIKIPLDEERPCSFWCDGFEILYHPIKNYKKELKDSLKVDAIMKQAFEEDGKHFFHQGIFTCEGMNGERKALPNLTC